jgi:hypothetical protein
MLSGLRQTSQARLTGPAENQLRQRIGDGHGPSPFYQAADANRSPAMR